MLNQLLETRQATQRKSGGTAVSVVLHVLVIGAAIQFTQHTALALTKPDETRVVFHEVKPEPVKPHEAPPPDVVAHQPNARGFTVLQAPVDVPVDIPAVDLTAARTDANAFTGTGVPGGTPDGVVGGTTVNTDLPLYDFQVDKAAAAIPGNNSPVYPAQLKAAGVEGEALVTFVVDTLGRAEAGSFKVLQATHDAFGETVRVALPRMRFLPAESNGKKVRMVVQQKFAFALDK